jgi:chromosome segregation ATPase
MLFIEELMVEVRDLTYQNANKKIKGGHDDQGLYDKLRLQEKELNQKIAQINIDFKKAQDDQAKEAAENNQEILNLKQKLNETKTESTLTLQYKESNADGMLQTANRLFNKEHSVLEKTIERLRKEIETEKIVSERIKGFYSKKANVLNDENDDRNKLQEVKTNNIKKEIEEIIGQKEEDEEEIARMEEDIKNEQAEQERREQQEAERQRELEAKRKERADMDDATRYLHWKWKWFNEEGRAWMKKKKKKKGKKKKK